MSTKTPEPTTDTESPEALRQSNLDLATGGTSTATSFTDVIDPTYLQPGDSAQGLGGANVWHRGEPLPAWYKNNVGVFPG
jgi:hypothetical protein